MAMIMDTINGNTSLTPRMAALCFSPEALSYHGYEASTSLDLSHSGDSVYDFGYSRVAFTPATSSSNSCAHSPISYSEEAPRSNTSPPGPTSCVFLMMALKRLYSKEDFEICESLGEGFFSDVYKVRHRVTNEIMVLKVGKERDRESRSRVKASVLKEVAVLKQLTSHPNLLAFRGVCVDTAEGLWNLHILVDFCDGGSLSRLICDTQKLFPWRIRIILARDIACAMDYVHSKSIMHRDLTSMNVLLQRCSAFDLKAVVADFGLSCKIPESSERLVQVGTPYWMAPECLKEEYYDEKADVFSYGIILCQMIARIDADPEAGLCRTHNFGLDYCRYTAHCPSDTPIELLELAFHCCLMDPVARPIFKEACEYLNKLSSRWSGSNSSSTLKVESESKLGRSKSDAALKSNRMSQNAEPLRYLSSRSEEETLDNSQSAFKAIASKPLFIVAEEGDLSNDDERKKKSQMEELARSVAVVEPSDEEADNGNPFMLHEIYSTTRKLGPFPELVDNKKRNGQDCTDGCVNGSSALPGDNFGAHIVSYKSSIMRKSKKRRRGRKMSRLHRSVSLSSSPLVLHRRFLTATEAALDPSLPSSSSASTTPTKNRVIVHNLSEQGRIPMTFKDRDQKFTSLRYPSRRYIVMKGDLLGERVVTVEPRPSGCSLSHGDAASTDNFKELLLSSPHDLPAFGAKNASVVMRQPLSVKTSLDNSSMSQYSEQSNVEISLSPPPELTIEGYSIDCAAENVWISQNQKILDGEKLETIVLSTEDSDSPSKVLLNPFCSASQSCQKMNCRKKMPRNEHESVEKVRLTESCIII